MQDPKNRQKVAIWAPSHKFVGLYLRNKGTYRQSAKKLVKQQCISQMSSQYGEHRPTSRWDPLASFGHPCKFQRFSRLDSVTAATSLIGGQPNFARCLAVTWAGRLCIHFRRLLPRNGILPRAKFTLRPPSLALSYWQRYCTALEQWARDKLCGVEHRAPPIWATIKLGNGPHSTPCLKKLQNSFCQNFFEFPPILITFGRKTAKRLKLCEVHSFSTSSNLRHHTTVLSADVPNCYTTLQVVSTRSLTIASSIRQRAPRDLMSLWD